MARARTLTVLGRLDGSRKRSVLQFLYESGLVDTDQRIVDLAGADLSGADLIGAALRGANLRGANLGRVAGIPGSITTKEELDQHDNEELDQQAWSLEGATMPNGQKYEDWLKDRGRKEDAENE